MEFSPSTCDSDCVGSDEPAPARPGRPSLGGDYWRLWTSAALSNLADGILKIALTLVAVSFTRSPGLIAGLALAFTLPWLLFSLPAGAIADRFDRRRLMLGANALRATLLGATALTVLLHSGSIWILYIVALLVGTAETIYDTAAQSIVPQIVRRDQLPRANGRMYAAELTSNEFVGPPLAGFLIAAGAAVALATPAALWVVAIVALLLVRGSFRIERGPAQTVSMRRDIAEGIRFLWRNSLLRMFAAVAGVFNFASSAMQAVLVLYVVGSTSAMGLSEQAYGWLLSTIAVGSLLGSFFADRIERIVGRTRTLVLGFVAGSLFVGAPALTASPYLVGAAFFVGGAGLVVANVVMLSLRQRITPERLLGRVNSGILFVAGGTKPLGAIAAGVLAQLFGVRAVFIIMGLLSLATLFTTRKMTDEAMDAAERRVDH
jgi:MFS family permease